MRPVRVVVTVLVLLGIAYGCERVSVSFIQFGARAKTAEAKTCLKQTWLAQRAFFADAGRWATSFDELHLELGPGNRYRYALGPRRDAGTNVVDIDNRFGAAASESVHLAALPADAWGPLDAGAFVLFATGDIDVDPTLDVWRVTSLESACNGVSLEAGAPCHLTDDVTSN